MTSCMPRFRVRSLRSKLLLFLLPPLVAGIAALTFIALGRATDETERTAYAGEVGDVAAVAEQSSAATQQVSAGTQQTSASTQEIASSAQELARSAEELERLVSQFRV
jgi:methyl-accepting chemotaxis protein